MLSSAMVVKVKDSVASMMAPANANPNDSPNDPAAELTPAASLDPFLRNRRQRVVVELRHQQPQTAAGNHKWDQEIPAGLSSGNDRDQHQPCRLL